MGFGKHALGLLQIQQNLCATCDVRAALRDRQGRRISSGKLHVRRIPAALASKPKHGVATVDSQDVAIGTHQRRYFPGEITGAAADIDDAVTVTRFQQLNGPSPLSCELIIPIGAFCAARPLQVVVVFRRRTPSGRQGAGQSHAKAPAITRP